MGSHNRWYVDAQSTEEQTSAIIVYGRSLDKTNDIYWDQFCWRKWCEHTKWEPIELIRNISIKFPEIIFSISYHGDYGSGKLFVLNGKDIEENLVFKRPRFPTATALKKAIKDEEKAATLRRIQMEKERAAKAAAENQRRIQQLEEELKKLKAVPMDLGGQHG